VGDARARACGLLLLALLLAACRPAVTSHAPFQKPPSTGRVRVAGRALLVDGRPFQIRGVGYSPVPIGRRVNEHDMYADPAIWGRDLPALRAMHANTIRTWGPVTSHALLQAAYNGGRDPIYAIMGFWVEPSSDLGAPAVRDRILADFRRYVAEYKDEPGVLMWGVGNEVNMGYAGPKRDWYRLLNDLGRVAYEVEGPAYHPVATANWEIANIGAAASGASDADLPYLDVWGLTAYRGRDFGDLFRTYAGRSARPLWIAEFGVDAWDHRAGREDAAAQADYDGALWDAIAAERAVCVGGTVMAYSDEWWKAGDPQRQQPGGFPNPFFPDGQMDESYFGVVAVSRDPAGGADRIMPRAAYHALAARWGAP
jgi:hypothetical protein